MVEDEIPKKATDYSSIRNIVIMLIVTIVVIIIFVYLRAKRQDMENITTPSTDTVASIYENSYINGAMYLSMILVAAAFAFSLYLAIVTGVSEISSYALAAVCAGLLYSFIRIWDISGVLTKEVATTNPEFFVGTLSNVESYMIAVCGIMTFALIAIVLIRHGEMIRAKMASASKAVSDKLNSAGSLISNSASNAAKSVRGKASEVFSKNMPSSVFIDQNGVKHQVPSHRIDEFRNMLRPERPIHPNEVNYQAQQVQQVQQVQPIQTPSATVEQAQPQQTQSGEKRSRRSGNARSDNNISGNGRNYGIINSLRSSATHAFQ